ncbi:MAG TPA: site-specific DNA-methyltransferase [Candidatus Thermoplasmatota archaeon]|nr:site-specific DNA-methyltransferase [Candidatus Thermoplasmatota archaeon]
MHGPGARLRDQGHEVALLLDAMDRTPRVFEASSEKMALPEESVHLVVTSPPYPLIEMWDGLFESWTGRKADAPGFYDACHQALAGVWRECARVLVPGGIVAINVGDATRTWEGAFRLYPNHVDVTQRCVEAGLTPLVPILWKKPTNKPNAFLGSGFLPPNAYVTLDCEHILLFRKGPPRKLPPKDLLRYASEMSKAERDVWFSQVWDFKGIQQDSLTTSGGRPPEPPFWRRTAAFPEELPYRLVRMFSCLGETVLDPFAGTGTTLRAAAAEGRRAIGFETEPALAAMCRQVVPPAGAALVERLRARYRA